MHARRLIPVLGLGFLLSSLVAAQPTTDVETLVRKLGSSSYVQRETACKQLQAIGAPALEPLRKAAKTADLETARRISELVRIIEERQTFAKILTPKEIHLNVKDVSVQQAISELAQVSGYQIQFLGDNLPLADKKITLDTKASFWQVFDQLCDKAGLMMRVEAPEPNQPMYQKFGKAGRLRMLAPSQGIQAGPIIVTNRGSEKVAVHHAGAVRIEVRITRDAKAKELIVTFSVSPEPKLQNAAMLGKPAFEKLLDEHGRSLAVVQPKVSTKEIPDEEIWMYTEWPQLFQRVAQVRVKEGPDAVRQLKELAGRFTLNVEVNNEVIAKHDNVLGSVGKSVSGANGGMLLVNSVDKRDGGNLEIQLTMENLTPNPFGEQIIFNGRGGVMIRGNVNGGVVIGPNGVRINGNGNARDLPDLIDAKGQKYSVASILAESTNLNNGSVTRSVRLVYQPPAGSAEPRDLVLHGTRAYAIGVPFRFENIPVP